MITDTKTLSTQSQEIMSFEFYRVIVAVILYAFIL